LLVGSAAVGAADVVKVHTRPRWSDSSEVQLCCRWPPGDLVAKVQGRICYL